MCSDHQSCHSQPLIDTVAAAIGEAVASLASLLMEEGAGEQALELALHVLDYAASSQSTIDYNGRLRADLEAHMTRQQVEAVQARAQAQTFDAVVKEVLKQAELA
jgi:hypothetical protein